MNVLSSSGITAETRLRRALVFDYDNSVISRGVLIKYIDEETELAEAAHFRLELETKVWWPPFGRATATL